MNPVWAQRREEVWSDCIVSPDIFNQMVDRLGGCPRINAHGPWRLEEVGRSCSTGPCTSSREHTHLPMPRSDVLQRAISVS